MKRCKPLGILLIVAAAAVSAIALLAVLSMKTLLLLPAGEWLGDFPAPDGRAVVSVYRCDGGATTDCAIRCAVRGDGLLRRNLYWAYHEDSATVEWQSARVCVINGVPIDIVTGRYDYRAHTAP